MNSDRFCDGCEELDFADAVNAYDVYAARCNDPEKPGGGKPFGIIRPAWCRGKRKPTP